MPDFHSYRDVPLDEAIDYFNAYYERAKDTEDLKWYTYSLDGFISPKWSSNTEYIERLREKNYGYCST